MLILKDTREQKPLRFSHPQVRATKKVTLDYGDYSCVLESKYGEFVVPVFFERKSISDLFGTLGRGHERFRKELNRAHKKGHTIIIIIEGTLTEVLAGYPRSKMQGPAIAKTLFTLWVKYDVPCVFCSSRGEMARFIVEYYVAWGKMYMKNKGKI